MFVPVIAYDPDMFADFTFVLSQQEISTASQPYKTMPIAKEYVSGIKIERTAQAVDALTLAIYLWSAISKQTTSASDAAVLNPVLATQIQSGFMPKTFASNPPAPYASAPMVMGSFQTVATLDHLFDNIVFRVSVGNLDLSDTKEQNKSVAPVVS